MKKIVTQAVNPGAVLINWKAGRMGVGGGVNSARNQGRHTSSKLPAFMVPSTTLFQLLRAMARSGPAFCVSSIHRLT